MLLVAVGMRAQSGSLDAIRDALELSSKVQVQEKVYIHTDNNAYFVGDTLWYKAYVVRADDLRFTDMSRILYVELLNPDGLLVERQQIIVSDKGFSNGNFHITDSLYSGYYELRAYTRWMLNFNVSEKRHSREDDRFFYNYAMADDFFRTWDGLYSRVFPVYEKPEQAGNYDERVIYNRPKERLTPIPKPELNVEFYPEGGHLVMGVPNRVAFEVTDQYGAAVDIEGKVKGGETTLADVKTVHLGRGVFTITPVDSKMKAHFKWNGKDYDFKLPEAEEAGVALTLADGQAKLVSRGLPADKEYGVSIICRGALHHFQTLTFAADNTASVALPPLPTGVNDITVFNSDGRILADRLFFVNNHDYDGDTLSVYSDTEQSPITRQPITYQPHERVDLSLSYAAAEAPMLLSVSVRDAGTDADSYDDGNIMTDLLLGSELKGFVANPAYYFEDDSRERADALDMLMMVQGWRKYNWVPLADTAGVSLRYLPEKTMTIEGGVYKMYGFDEIVPMEIQKWAKGKGKIDVLADAPEDMEHPNTGEVLGGPSVDENTYSTDDIGTQSEEETDGDMYASLNDVSVAKSANYGPLKKEVYIEAELFMGDNFVGGTQMTKNGGRFLFEIPPFYGVSILNMKAYTQKDSVKMNMASRKDKHAFDESHYPDFYVKRDLFYPIFASKYNYYQNHQPQIVAPEYEEVLSMMSQEDDAHELKTVNVKGKSRRARRGIDYTKPAYVRDAYELYNDMTDYGLSWGKYNLRVFPIRAARFLFGNMNRHNKFNVAGRHHKYTFYRTFVTSSEPMDLMGRSYVSLYNDLQLKRLMNIRFFTDFELRNNDSTMIENQYTADVTVDFVNIPDNGRQVTYRDRHIMLPGFNEPAHFYHRDYTDAVPEKPTDYRRTLYWNPNARTDAEGKLNVSFFNNSKQTRIKVTAAGITRDGKLVRM